MNYQDLIERLDPSVYQNLRRAVELGKWPDGRTLTDEQRSTCMEAILYYERVHDLPEAQRVGYVDRRRQDEKGIGDGADPIRILN